MQILFFLFLFSTLSFDCTFKLNKNAQIGFLTSSAIIKQNAPMTSTTSGNIDLGSGLGFSSAKAFGDVVDGAIVVKNDMFIDLPLVFSSDAVIDFGGKTLTINIAKGLLASGAATLKIKNATILCPTNGCLCVHNLTLQGCTIICQAPSSFYAVSDSDKLTLDNCTMIIGKEGLGWNQGSIDIKNTVSITGSDTLTYNYATNAEFISRLQELGFGYYSSHNLATKGAYTISFGSDQLTLSDTHLRYFYTSNSTYSCTSLASDGSLWAVISGSVWIKSGWTAASGGTIYFNGDTGLTAEQVCAGSLFSVFAANSSGAVYQCTDSDRGTFYIGSRFNNPLTGFPSTWGLISGITVKTGTLSIAVGTDGTLWYIANTGQIYKRSPKGVTTQIHSGVGYSFRDLSVQGTQSRYYLAVVDANTSRALVSLDGGTFKDLGLQSVERVTIDQEGNLGATFKRLNTTPNTHFIYLRHSGFEYPILATDKTFTFSASGGANLTIKSGSTLALNPNTTLRMNANCSFTESNYVARRHLVFEDGTSTLSFNQASLEAVCAGLSITQGNLVANGACFLKASSWPNSHIEISTSATVNTTSGTFTNYGKVLTLAPASMMQEITNAYGYQATTLAETCDYKSANTGYIQAENKGLAPIGLNATYDSNDKLDGWTDRSLHYGVEQSIYSNDFNGGGFHFYLSKTGALFYANENAKYTLPTPMTLDPSLLTGAWPTWGTGYTGVKLFNTVLLYPSGNIIQLKFSTNWSVSQMIAAQGIIHETNTINIGITSAGTMQARDINGTQVFNPNVLTLPSNTIDRYSFVCPQRTVTTNGYPFGYSFDLIYIDAKGDLKRIVNNSTVVPVRAPRGLDLIKISAEPDIKRFGEQNFLLALGRDGTVYKTCNYMLNDPSDYIKGGSLHGLKSTGITNMYDLAGTCGYQFLNSPYDGAILLIGHSITGYTSKSTDGNVMFIGRGLDYSPNGGYVTPYPRGGIQRHYAFSNNLNGGSFLTTSDLTSNYSSAVTKRFYDTGFCKLKVSNLSSGFNRLYFVTRNGTNPAYYSTGSPDRAQLTGLTTLSGLSPSTARELSVGVDNTVCAVKSHTTTYSDGVYKWNGSSWDYIGLSGVAGAAFVAVGNSSNIWAIKVDGTLHKYSSGTTWTAINLYPCKGVRSVAAASDGGLWLLDQAGDLWFRSSGGVMTKNWDAIDFDLIRLSAAGTSSNYKLAALDRNGNLYSASHDRTFELEGIGNIAEVSVGDDGCCAIVFAIDGSDSNQTTNGGKTYVGWVKNTIPGNWPH